MTIYQQAVFISDLHMVCKNPASSLLQRDVLKERQLLNEGWMLHKRCVSPLKSCVILENQSCQKVWLSA